jgi:hypothetical protein
MAFLFYNSRKKKDRFELEMNRREAEELLVACRMITNNGILQSVTEQLQQFFDDERQWKTKVS